MPESDARWYPAKRKPSENGASSLPPPNIVKFAPVYNMHVAEREALSPSPNGRNGHGPRHPRVDHDLAYADLAAKATRVRTFAIDLVDGLLQTPEYAAAVIRANQPLASEETVRQRVEAWTLRHASVRDPRTHLEVILTEAALHVQVGGRDVMRRQLAHLLELADLSTVDIRVVPFGGAYPAMGTPFHILSFGGRRPDVGYVELLDTGLFVEEPDDIEMYVVRFAGLRDVALDQEQTRRVIATIESGAG
jgi:hypothetical protein